MTQTPGDLEARLRAAQICENGCAALMIEAADELARLRRMAEWQDIASAPKTHEIELVHIDHEGALTNLTYGMWLWEGDDPEFGYWYNTLYDQDMSFTPTHFRELPSPPGDSK